MSTDPFEEDRRTAIELLENEDVDGLFVGVTRDDEMDYVMAHRVDEPESVGRRALSLLAQHVRGVAEQAGLELGRVASDAARLAESIEDR